MWNVVKSSKSAEAFVVPLQKSSELLQTATAAVQTHEAALESMKGKLATMHSSSAQRAAADAALLAEQVQNQASMLTSIPLISYHRPFSHLGYHSDMTAVLPWWMPLCMPATSDATVTAHAG